MDWIGSYWQASAGSRSLDLSATSAGSVSQSGIVTVVGQQYRVTFDMAGNVDSASAVKRLTALATGGTTATYSFDTTNKSYTNMQWATYTYDFTASSLSTTLTFTSLENSAYGSTLDNVRMTPVSEPAAALLAALPLLWRVCRRARRAA